MPSRILSRAIYESDNQTNIWLNVTLGRQSSAVMEKSGGGKFPEIKSTNPAEGEFTVRSLFCEGERVAPATSFAA